MDEAVAALIVLTDGFGPAPESASQIPTLWALTSDGEKPAPWGETIRLPDFTHATHSATVTTTSATLAPLINIPEGFTMTTSHDSRFAGGLVLNTALISWAGLGQAQDMWSVWAGRVGNVEIRMCAQSDPDRPFDGDFAAIYTTQDYQIVLLDRVAIANSHVFCCSLRLAIRRARRSRAKS